MNKNKWLPFACCLLQLVTGHAQQNNQKPGIDFPLQNKALSSSHYNLGAAYSYKDFKFDSSKLLSVKKYPELSSLYDTNHQGFKLGKRFSGGFFVYNLEPKLNNQLTALSWSTLSGNQGIAPGTLYGHLLTRLMQHVFFDLAGGYGQNKQINNTYDYLTYQAKNGVAYNLNKDWFASATALFTHTWREFAFNFNMGALHAGAVKDPYNSYFALTPSIDFIKKTGNTVSFLQENAELSYRINESVQPFIDGGLLQSLEFGSTGTSAFGSTPDLNPELSGYKLGGGLAFNYKQYVFRLEQQYFQRGNDYHSNQSTLSVVMNIG